LSSLGSEGGEDDHGDHGSHLYKLLGLIMFMILLILYITIGSFMEVKKFAFGHETGVIIFLGALCSAASYTFLVLYDGLTVKQATQLVRN
jgi:hypothetical protein